MVLFDGKKLFVGDGGGGGHGWRVVVVMMMMMMMKKMVRRLLRPLLLFVGRIAGQGGVTNEIDV